MADRLDHEDAMKLAVQLACSYLGTSHSGTTDAEDLILNYYRQIRHVEKRLGTEFADPSKQEEDVRAAA